MPLYVKDTNINQTEKPLTENLHLQWAPTYGNGLKLEDAILGAEPIFSTTSTGLHPRMFTAPFKVSPTYHNYKYKDTPINAIEVEIDWQAVTDSTDVFSLETSKTHLGPWREVARVGAVVAPLNLETKIVKSKHDIFNNFFGTKTFINPAYIDSPSDAAYETTIVKNQSLLETKHENIQGCFAFNQIDTSYETNIELNDIEEIEFHLMTMFPDWDNGQKLIVDILQAPSSLNQSPLKTLVVDKAWRDTPRPERMDGQGFSYGLFVDNAFGNIKVNTRDLSGLGIIRFTHIVPVGSRQRTGAADADTLSPAFAVAAISAYTKSDVTAPDTKRKFWLQFDNIGEFFGIVGENKSARPYVSGVDAFQDDANNYYRMSVEGTHGATDVIKINPAILSTGEQSPEGNNSTKWWNPKDIYVKKDNSWQKSKEVYVKEAGAWVKVFPQEENYNTTRTALPELSPPKFIVVNNTPIFSEEDLIDSTNRVAIVQDHPTIIGDWRIICSQGNIMDYAGAKPVVGDLCSKYVQNLEWRKGLRTTQYTLENTTDTEMNQPDYFKKFAIPSNRVVLDSRTKSGWVSQQYSSLSDKEWAKNSVYSWNNWPHYNSQFTGWDFKGYFYPKQSASYRFYTKSDDGSGLWVGEDCVHGHRYLTDDNATVANHGLHSARIVASGERGYGGVILGSNGGGMYLEANKYYPVYMYYFENKGPASDVFSVMVSWDDPNYEINESSTSEDAFGSATPNNNRRVHQPSEWEWYHRGSGWNTPITDQ